MIINNASVYRSTGAPTIWSPYPAIIGNTVAVSGLANRAYAQTLPDLPAPKILNQAIVYVGTASGNICVAVIAMNNGTTGRRICTTGSVAMAGGTMFIPFTAKGIAVPGTRYGIVAAIDNTTGSIRSPETAIAGPYGGGLVGFRVDAAFPIPDPCFSATYDSLRAWAIAVS